MFPKVKCQKESAKLNSCVLQFVDIISLQNKRIPLNFFRNALEQQQIRQDYVTSREDSVHTLLMLLLKIQGA
jgi:hypothetical protein